jgi:hypothetical protein
MAKKKRPSARRKTQRTMFDAAKSGAASMQRMALRAATEAATAAAEAAVQAVIRSFSRESAARRQPKSKRRKMGSRAARKKRP